MKVDSNPESVTNVVRKVISPETVPTVREREDRVVDMVDPDKEDQVQDLVTTVASPAIWPETVRNPEMRITEVEEDSTMTVEVIEVVREEEVENATTVVRLVTSPRTALPKVVVVKEVVIEVEIEEEVTVVTDVKEEVTEKEVRLPVTTVTRPAIWLVNVPRKEDPEVETVVDMVETVVVISHVTIVDRLVTSPENAPPRNEDLILRNDNLLSHPTLYKNNQ